MGSEILRPLEFRHGVPVPFGHMGHAAAGVFPLPDGDGVIKSLPQLAVRGFCLVRRRHLKMLQWEDHSLSVGIEQRLPVGTVVNEKFFVLIAAAKVAPQHR